jgi:small subunit ribosomal protein S2
MISSRVKELLEAGVHFGHQTRRWNPKMKPFIFAARNGIYIIDLQKTSRKLREALAFAADAAARGGTFLFVGTKRQAQEVVVEEARRCNQYYIDQRWLGGTMTNFVTIRKSIARLRELDALVEDEDEAAKLTKKERSRVDKDRARLDKSLSGIRTMERLPQALFVIDPQREKIAVAEANKLGIPVIAVVDTNCDPEPIDFPIPGNDDAIRANSLLIETIAAAVEEGRYIASRRPKAAVEEADAPAKQERSPEEEAAFAQAQAEARAAAARAQAEREQRLTASKTKPAPDEAATDEAATDEAATDEAATDEAATDEAQQQQAEATEQADGSAPEATEQADGSAPEAAPEATQESDGSAPEATEEPDGSAPEVADAAEATEA